MSDDRVRSIVLVGAGAPAWLAAAILARVLKQPGYRITLVEPRHRAAREISYASLPSLHRAIALLGINEADLVRKTRATFRLGTRFDHWGRPGEQYFHGFGSVGARFEALPFHHQWSRLRQAGEVAGLEEFSPAAMAARAGRFAPPLADARSVLSLYSYAYHFDAELLTAYLREYALAHGVVRLERNVREVRLAADGFIEALRLDDDSSIEADLYVDGGGATGQLFERMSEAPDGWQAWSRWLPCDRIVEQSFAGDANPPPYSEASACAAGWQWQVALRGRVDGGYAFCSDFMSDEQAAAALSPEPAHGAPSDHSVPTPHHASAEPHVRSIARGRPREFWAHNFLTLPGAALPPLESTALHFVQTGITRLLALFPVQRFSPKDMQEYNRQTALEYDRVRDFLILHFKATARADSPFWNYCRSMEVPETLRQRLELFQRCGRIALLDEEHFGEDSWLTAMVGQGINPQSYDPLADVADVERVRAAFERMRLEIRNAVHALPTHGQFLEALGRGEIRRPA